MQHTKIYTSTKTLSDVQLSLDLGADGSKAWSTQFILSPLTSSLPPQYPVKGIGDCSTEHMFFCEETINIARAALLSTARSERISHLNMMISHQEDELLNVFKLFNNRPICIRLLDPPLYEYTLTII